LQLVLFPACVEGFVEKVHGPLALNLIVLRMFRVLFNNIVESVHGMVHEVSANFFGSAVVGQGLQRLKFWLLHHFRRQLLTSQRMIFEIFGIIIEISLRATLIAFEQAFEVLVLFLFDGCTPLLWSQVWQLRPLWDELGFHI